MPSGLLGNGTKPSVIDARAMLDSDIPRQVAELVSMGVLVSIGTTRDRGALSITVTHDGDWDREYFRDSAEAVDWLRLAATTLRSRGIGDPEPDLPATQKPTRRRQRLS
jgi:hypothetical protein